MFSSFKGGMLTGTEIEKQVKKGNIEISNFDPSRINPNSYNLTLSEFLMCYTEAELDMKKANPADKYIIPDDGYVIYPGVLYIGSTVERVHTDKFIPMLEGRSSIGRLGITIHVCAGFGDIGFGGTWTLEITAVQPVRIYKNSEIAQVSFFTPYGKKPVLYNGKYNGQILPKTSKMYEDRSLK